LIEAPRDESAGAMALNYPLLSGVSHCSVAEVQVESSPSDARRESWFDPDVERTSQNLSLAEEAATAFSHKEWLWDDRFWRKDGVIGRPSLWIAEDFGCCASG
jgi:hypothetical protein